MKNSTRIIIVILLIVIVGGVVILKQVQKNNTNPKVTALDTENPASDNDEHALPRLLDLGAGTERGV